MILGSKQTFGRKKSVLIIRYLLLVIIYLVGAIKLDSLALKIIRYK